MGPLKRMAHQNQSLIIIISPKPGVDEGSILLKAISETRNILVGHSSGS